MILLAGIKNMISLKHELFMEIPEFIMTAVKRLHKKGFEAYIVGGAVRDILLGRPATDWDITTSASPEQIRSLFHDIRNFTIKHNTVTLVYSGRHYEVTTMRDSGHAIPALEEDLKHRDFTINSMAYDIANDVVLDPNRGREDILRKTIRAVGNPYERFNEDPVRLLRAVRIALELGFIIDSGTMDAICNMSDRLASVAPERIRDELIKILVSRKPSQGFKILRNSGLLIHFLPELLEGFMKRQNSHHRYTIYRHIMETIDKSPPDIVIRLTALLHDIAKPRVRQKIRGEFRFFRHAEESARLGREIMERLRFSNDIIDQVTNMIMLHMIDYESNWTDGAVRRLMRSIGTRDIDRMISFRKADLWAHGYEDEKLGSLLKLEKRVKEIKRESVIRDPGGLAVGGKDVMDILGISPGPQVGKVLNILLERVTDGPELNTKQGLTNILKDLREKGLAGTS
jgi:tRNA nucleotidyltransferase (CCA-adding enzyme)